MDGFRFVAYVCKQIINVVHSLGNNGKATPSLHFKYFNASVQSCYWQPEAAIN